MRVLVLGATGATGQRLVRQLLERGHDVKLIVRSTERLPEEIHAHKNISIIKATILDLDDKDILQQVQDCDAVACCLGHTLSFHGIFGHPRRLVTESVRRLCETIQTNAQEKPIKFILMNSAGCQNHDTQERICFGQLCVLGLLRILLPPHADNEDAADYLRVAIGQNHPFVEWAVVRPDNLINDNSVSPYTVHPSPIRSAIFNAGTTSRINVAHFMANLITDPDIWDEWNGQMPVIYNQS